MKNFKSKTKAFTIVETLVTLMAITIMISAPFTFMTRSYNYAGLITVKILATGLSQEGLELVTGFRNNDLSAFITAASSCSSSCSIDWDGSSVLPTMVPCTGPSCELNTIDAENGFYRAQSAGGTPSGYFRYVKLTPNGTQGYVLESTVYSYVEDNLIKVTLKKVISNIQIR
jgi:type II secretory pathway pseudopilin PulG